MTKFLLILWCVLAVMLGKGVGEITRVDGALVVSTGMVFTIVFAVFLALLQMFKRGDDLYMQGKRDGYNLAQHPEIDDRCLDTLIQAASHIGVVGVEPQRNTKHSKL